MLDRHVSGGNGTLRQRQTKSKRNRTRDMADDFDEPTWLLYNPRKQAMSSREMMVCVRPA